MKNIATFGSLLLLTSALVAPAALAQTQPPVSTPPTTPEIADPGTQADAQPSEEPFEAQIPGAVDPGEDQVEEVEISAPGTEGAPIIVTGRFIPDVIRRTPQVLSVLSAEDIARTGEGDIAGALGRVTGLSVVGGRFVYVRGLGERYSLALLNGSPLPSPDPLRRVVPLDIFPTSIVASASVQKSYSVAYPGEFGGGVINLTTKAVPEEGFLTIGGSLGWDSETTNELGYTYDGGDWDWTGFDDGRRDIPDGLAAALESGNPIVVGVGFTEEEVKNFTTSLNNADTSLIQRNDNIPINWGVNLAAGDSWTVGDGNLLGLVFNAGYSHSWQTKAGLQQLSGGAIGAENPVLNPDRNFQFVSTENRIVVNALLGLGFEFGEHELRWTNLFIRDTIKDTRVRTGVDTLNVGDQLLQTGDTAWFERQLLDTQFVAEFDWDPVSFDFRATAAQAKRDAPYERSYSYAFNETAGDFVNDLTGPGQRATIAFSELTDNVYGVAGDLAYVFPTERLLRISAGLGYTYNDRESTRRSFRFNPLEPLPFAVAQERIDFLLSDFNVQAFDIVLTDTSGAAGAARYTADLEVFAAYIEGESEIADGLRIVGGVRFEKGEQNVIPVDLFGVGGGEILPSQIEEEYFLPAATVTWNFAEDMQLRLHGSKTIARPQFRELSPQQYQDIESDRTFFGNQFLVDTELLNGELRYEWFFARDQRFTAAAFYKKLDNPIEAVAFTQGGTFFTTFANAPEATLYGVEFELQKYVPLDAWSSNDFFVSRRLVLIGNYTYSNSEITVNAGDTTIPIGTGGVPVPASNVFTDGDRLSGQSDHLVNLQIGLEDTDRLSQQTILLTYASDRITNRGPSGQPDFIEEPGLRVDFVVRQGFEVRGVNGELKFEVRNIFGQDYEEFQTLNDSRIDINTYDLGTTFSLGASFNF